MPTDLLAFYSRLIDKNVDAIVPHPERGRYGSTVNVLLRVAS
jgi:hypothetical protein